MIKFIIDYILNNLHFFVFELTFLLVIIFGLMAVYSESRIYSICFLISSYLLFAITCCFAGMEFIGLILIMVYIGAIAIFFVFIVMTVKEIVQVVKNLKIFFSIFSSVLWVLHIIANLFFDPTIPGNRYRGNSSLFLTSELRQKILDNNFSDLTKVLRGLLYSKEGERLPLDVLENYLKVINRCMHCVDSRNFLVSLLRKIADGQSTMSLNEIILSMNAFENASKMFKFRDAELKHLYYKKLEESSDVIVNMTKDDFSRLCIEVLNIRKYPYLSKDTIWAIDHSPRREKIIIESQPYYDFKNKCFSTRLKSYTIPDNSSSLHAQHEWDKFFLNSLRRFLKSTDNPFLNYIFGKSDDKVAVFETKVQVDNSIDFVSVILELKYNIELSKEIAIYMANNYVTNSLHNLGFLLYDLSSSGFFSIGLLLLIAIIAALLIVGIIKKQPRMRESIKDQLLKKFKDFKKK